MLVNGYKIIDFKDVALNSDGSTSVNIKGIYDALKEALALGKPIECVNLMVGTSRWMIHPVIVADNTTKITLNLCATADESDGVKQQQIDVMPNDNVKFTYYTYKA